MTAAPRITDASGEVIFPASMSVRAEIETLVAVSAPPRNHAAFQFTPRRWATPAPRKNGQITPRSATKNAVGPASRIRSMSVSRPAINISTNPPIWARSMNASPAGVPLNRRMCSMFRQPGPAATPDHQLAEDGRNAEARADGGYNLSGGKKDGDQ